ncbi:MAG TPA: MoaD/ThiS family protein [Candidatus Nanoarchaeia archaeon]|nr:MoaD/ThiS family protein [Candidatus Nanoarchaeia archaeon]
MKVQVFIERTKKMTSIDLPAKATVKDIFAKLQLNPVTVLVTRDNAVIIEQTLLKDKDKLTILSVVSGG